MDALYHLTYKDNVDKIMAEGLLPQIGPNSQRCAEPNPSVYLCDKDSVPYWAKILNADCVIMIPVNALKRKQLSDFKYSHYKEWRYPSKIPAKYLLKSKIKKLTPKQEKELALSYLYALNDICISYAKCYLEAYDFEDENELKEELQALTESVKIDIEVMKRLDYTSIDKKEIKSLLKELGEGGEYTMCDECDFDEQYGKAARIYQKLIKYPEDEYSQTRKELYKFIRTTFKGCLNVDTGGFRT